MIKCKLYHLINKCYERGFSLEEVKDCIIEQNGEDITVDENHPKYPRNTKPGFVPKGVGTELKKLLSKIGINATPNCSCNKRALFMDKNGIEWCENNIDTIVGWLREEATKRKLPFIDMAGRILVRKAIRNAKKR